MIPYGSTSASVGVGCSSTRRWRGGGRVVAGAVPGTGHPGRHQQPPRRRRPPGGRRRVGSRASASMPRALPPACSSGTQVPTLFAQPHRAAGDALPGDRHRAVELLRLPRYERARKPRPRRPTARNGAAWSASPRTAPATWTSHRPQRLLPGAVEGGRRLQPPGRRVHSANTTAGPPVGGRRGGRTRPARHPRVDLAGGSPKRRSGPIASTGAGRVAALACTTTREAVDGGVLEPDAGPRAAP